MGIFCIFVNPSGHGNNISINPSNSFIFTVINSISILSTIQCVFVISIEEKIIDALIVLISIYFGIGIYITDSKLLSSSIIPPKSYHFSVERNLSYYLYSALLIEFLLIAIHTIFEHVVSDNNYILSSFSFILLTVPGSVYLMIYYYFDGELLETKKEKKFNRGRIYGVHRKYEWNDGYKYLVIDTRDQCKQKMDRLLSAVYYETVFMKHKKGINEYNHQRLWKDQYFLTSLITKESIIKYIKSVTEYKPISIHLMGDELNTNELNVLLFTFGAMKLIFHIGFPIYWCFTVYNQWDVNNIDILTVHLFIPFMIIYCYYLRLHLKLFISIIWFNEYYFGFIRYIYNEQHKDNYNQFGHNLKKAKAVYDIYGPHIGLIINQFALNYVW